MRERRKTVVVEKTKEKRKKKKTSVQTEVYTKHWKKKRLYSDEIQREGENEEREQHGSKSRNEDKKESR